MLANQTALLEIVVRVIAVYAALVVMMRISGKRELGQLSPFDLMAMLLISETVSPSLTAQDTSLTGGLVAAAVLLLLTALVSRMTVRWRSVERWIDGDPVVIARDGATIEAGMRSERITRHELESALRKNGVLELAETRLVTVEPDGTISVVPRR